MAFPFSLVDHISDVLGIPKTYIRQSSYEDRVEAAVHKLWIKSFLRNRQPPEFLTHYSLGDDEVLAWIQQGEDLGQDWRRLYIKVIVKTDKDVIPLPRLRPSAVNHDQPSESLLSFGELLQYVSQTNHRNLWKESFKRYCPDRSYVKDVNDDSHINLIRSDLAIREIISRTYGCPFINMSYNQDPLKKSTHELESHCNILPALAAVETEKTFLIILPYISHTLQDCVSFSPAVLGSCHTKPLFIVYQLLQVMCSMHDRGLVLGDISLSDVLVTENLWIQVLPRLEDNIHEISSEHDASTLDCSSNQSKQAKKKNSTHGKKDQVQPLMNEQLTRSQRIGLEQACHLWVSGRITNLDYLTQLNELAGRRKGDPTCHHVLPWVTDFSAPNGSNWRDLTKSKFRLNKGDRQLDLTYDVTSVNSAQVPHHVSDVLSEITYYVYLARRTPKSVLCKVVRSVWVPAEYPSSIQRLQEWTPDECIPEFFTDPSVFKSIHEDLMDLELPSFASSPEDFIEKHREMLESSHVSERLNHWIDLTFGYKLSGIAAVKSKNVCLHLVDNHTTLSSSGVVQLFTQPHPPRLYVSPYWGRVPPRIFFPPRKSPDVKVERECVDDEILAGGFDEDDPSCALQNNAQIKSSSLALSRLLSRSRGSLLTPTAEDVAVPNLTPRTSTGAIGTISLPRDFNPVGVLQAVESLHSFLAKTFHHGINRESEQSLDWERRERTKLKLQVVAAKRMKEMQVLGCLMVEILLASRLRAMGDCSEERLRMCQAVVRCCGEQLPRCVRHIVIQLLQLQSTEDMELILSPSSRCSTVTGFGLPPASAHQLLQPLLSSMLLPFPRQFLSVFSLIRKTHEYAALSKDLSLRSESATGQEAQVRLVEEKLSECWVQSVALDLSWILPQLDSQLVQLLLPHVRQLLEDPSTAVLAAWYLFDPMAQALGPLKTCSSLLDCIVKLYSEFRTDKSGNPTDSLECSGLANRDRKQAKLYHRSFLLRLMVRLGLHTFLDNFIAPLVEAVGGYHETSHNCHGKSPINRRIATDSSPLQSCSLDENNINDGNDIHKPLKEGVLSPMDEDLSAGEFEQQHNQRSPMFEADGEGTDVEVEPEMFVLENDEEAAPIQSLMEQLDFQDDGDEYEAEVSVPQVTHLDSNNGPKSPTIPIPGTSETEVHYDSVTSSEALEQGELAGNFAADFSFASIAHSDLDSQHYDSRITRNSVGYKVSDMSADSLLWLAHRLGPVLSARYLSRNLLRMLSLCYLRGENLKFVENVEVTPSTANPYLNDSPRIINGILVGDRNAAKVLECLSSIAALYGEQIIVLQYLPHIGELIAHCRRKLTPNLESGLVGCLALFRHIVPYLSDNTLMDQLQDVILKTVLHPAVRLLSTTRLTYPSGHVARMAVAYKFCDALYLLAMRLGREMTHRHLAVPALQRFFLTFSKAHSDRINAHSYSSVPIPGASEYGSNFESSLPGETISPRSIEESSFLEIRRDGTTTEWTVRRGVPVQIGRSRKCDSESTDSYSPPQPLDKDVDPNSEAVDSDPVRTQAQEELRTVFNPRLAHLVYIPFFRFLGESVVEQSLRNHLLIRDLCFEYEQEMQDAAPSGIPPDTLYLSDYLSPPAPLDMERAGSGSFGTNVALIGNRIELQRPEFSSGGSNTSKQGDAIASGNVRMESNSARHLRGNWLAYWEHEIGRAEKDTRFNFKQIKLQTFTGHTNSVRSIVVLGNENSFLSGSRDKTVKLWSLRSQGDGTTVSQCQWSYTGHRKSVVSLAFIESLRLVASCDSVVQIWDPWLGRVISSQPGEQYGGTTASRNTQPVNVIRALPAPSASLLVATTDSTLRMLDARLCLYVNQLKVSLTPVGLIRCVVVAPNGNWAAIGQSSGFLTILDIRTGLVVASWKGHEGEVLQLVAVNDNTLVSSSLDQAVSVWNALDGKLKFHLKGPTEPVHCLAAYSSELISGTTANRIGVHTAIDCAASFSSTRLRSDTFRGVLTTMAVLPLNRLIILGADNGSINLLC